MRLQINHPIEFIVGVTHSVGVGGDFKRVVMCTRVVTKVYYPGGAHYSLWPPLAVK